MPAAALADPLRWLQAQLQGGERFLGRVSSAFILQHPTHMNGGLTRTYSDAEADHACLSAGFACGYMLAESRHSTSAALMASKAHSQLNTADTFPLVPQVLADTTHTALAQQSLQEGVPEYLRSTSCQRYLSQVSPGCCCAEMPGCTHACVRTRHLLPSLQLQLYFTCSARLGPVP